MTGRILGPFVSTLALAFGLGLAVPAVAEDVAPATPDTASQPVAEAPAAPAVDVVAPAAETAAITASLSSELPGAIRAFAAGAAVGKAGDLKRRSEVVARFYAEHADVPLWLGDTGFSAEAKALIARLGEADDDGLDTADFALPDAAFVPNAADPAAAAAEEFALSLAIATYGEEASGGRLAPTSIYKDITRIPERIAGQKALADVAASANKVATLEGFNPPNPEFARLRAKLVELRSTDRAEPLPPVSLTKTLKAGMSDPGVPGLRQRMGLAEVADAAAAPFYDEALVAAVEAFQTANGLNADGVIGARTLSVLNRGSRDLEGEIVANMEMWRWMPRNLSSDYVFVNVPEFKVRVFRHGMQVHEARVVVGKTTNQTPIFSGDMQYLMVNPYWNVPESIKIKEMLPEIKSDPVGYFSRHGYEATWNGQVIDPSRIIWDENAVKAVGIRQVPGEANALGHIKFMFPNKHAVYLHDTPLRSLFSRDVRAFSHGCVRVDDPMAFADAVLSGDPVWTVPKLEAMFGGPEQRVDISTHLKVHIAYFTVNVTDTGEVQVFDDIYGHVQRIEAAFHRSQI
jgi:murein L,D-transpeptidase YcbB/YkuD